MRAHEPRVEAIVSGPLLLGVGGIALLLAIAAIAVYGVAHAKTRRREQIGKRFPESNEEDTTPGTRV